MSLNEKEAGTGPSGNVGTAPCLVKEARCVYAGTVPSAPIVVDVYSADRCSLCHTALETLRRLAPELGLDVREHDIAGDPALRARYRLEIPVVHIAGEAAFIYRVDEAALRARVAALRSPNDISRST